MKLTTSFRPLPGFLSSQSKAAWTIIQAFNSFRPLPGFLSSQSFDPLHNKGTNTSFPSPSGVSIFSMNTPEFSRCKVYAFPSPSGVSIFSIRMLAMRDHDVRNSFRPLPGFLSSQLSQSGSPHVNIVSVPFRGFYLLNAKWCSAVIEDAAFPSPSGVSIFSIVNGEASDALWNSWFPSPSGVSIFSILNLYELGKKGGFRFRPLPGFLSSQY